MPRPLAEQIAFAADRLRCALVHVHGLPESWLDAPAERVLAEARRLGVEPLRCALLAGLLESQEFRRSVGAPRTPGADDASPGPAAES